MIAEVSRDGIEIEDPAGDSGDKIKFPVRFVVAGDYPWLAASLGLSGHAGTYPCVLCEIHQDKLGVWRESALNAPGFATLRTPERQRKLAHLFSGGGGRCNERCCNMTWGTRAAVQQHWDGLSNSKRSSFARDHFGTHCLEGYACGARAHTRTHAQK